MEQNKIVEIYLESITTGEERFVDVPGIFRKPDHTINFELISEKFGIPLDRMENHDTARLRFVGKIPEVKPAKRNWS
jgi:hypothetical protein